jgi:hypothetical protein
MPALGALKAPPLTRPRVAARWARSYHIIMSQTIRDAEIVLRVYEIGSPLLGGTASCCQAPGPATGHHCSLRREPRTSLRMREILKLRLGDGLAGVLAGGGRHVDTKLKAIKAVSRLSSHNALISVRKFGAGEGIRTLDPNLGKVATVIACLDRPYVGGCRPHKSWRLARCDSSHVREGEHQKTPFEKPF